MSYPSSLGAKKHACCEEKLTKEKGIGGERGYKRDGTPFTDGPRAQLPKESYRDFRNRIRGTTWPDACALDTDGNPAKFYDFKFGCEKDVPIKICRMPPREGVPLCDRKGSPILATGQSRPTIGSRQDKKYRRLSKKLGLVDSKGKPIPAQPISNKDCPP